MRLLFLFLSLYTLTASAQKEYKVYSNDSSAYVVVDESAVFHRMGGRDDALSDYVNKRLDFPKEAWKECKDICLPVVLTIRHDGRVSDVGIPSGVNSVLAERLKSILMDMPSWKPAQIKGQPVNSVFSTDIYLVENEITSSVRNPTGLPFSFLPWVKKMNRKAENKTYAAGLSHDDVCNMLSDLAEIVDVVPSNAKTSSAFLRLLVGIGNYGQAVALADSVVGAYRLNNTWDETDPQAYDGAVGRAGYEGRTEIWLRVLNALAVMESSLPADSLFNAMSEATLAVDKKIYNHDIVNVSRRRPYLRSYALESSLMQEKCDIVMRNPEKLASDEIAAIDHEQMLGPRVALIDKYISEGKISNARVIQITNELKGLHDRTSVIPNIKENTVRMYAVNALLEYLYGGTAAQDRYLLSVISGDGKTYAKELEALRATIAKAALTDADRKAVARCIAAYAPVKGVDDAKAFYELRKRVYAAYPIEWLGKCDI